MLNFTIKHFEISVLKILLKWRILAYGYDKERIKFRTTTRWLAVLHLKMSPENVEWRVHSSSFDCGLQKVNESFDLPTFLTKEVAARGGGGGERGGAYLYTFSQSR